MLSNSAADHAISLKYMVQTLITWHPWSISTNVQLNVSNVNVMAWERRRKFAIYRKQFRPAADCSISVKFGTEFDHMTPDVAYYTRWRSNGKGQGHSVKTSFDRQIIDLC